MAINLMKFQDNNLTILIQINVITVMIKILIKETSLDANNVILIFAINVQINLKTLKIHLINQINSNFHLPLEIEDLI